MEYLVKKYMWVVNLALVALIGGYVGNSAADYAGRKYLTVPFFSSGDLDARLASIVNEKTAEGADEAPSVEELIARYVFNVDRFLEDAEALEDDEGGEGEEEGPLDAGAGDEFEEAEMDAQLLGTMVAKVPDDSLALVKEGQNMKLVRLGMTIAETATVLAVRPKYIVVKKDGKIQILKLGAEAKKGAGTDKKRGKGKFANVPGKVSTHPKKASGPNNYKEWIKRTAANEYQIDRTMLNEELNDLTKLGSQARVVPNYKGGKYEGFKLIGVRPNSLYRAIGIRSGDVVKSVNGQELNSPNKAIKLFDELRSESKISVELERGGRTTALHYEVKQ